MFARMSDIDRMFGAMDLLRSKMDRLFTDFDRSFGDGPGNQRQPNPN